MNNNEFLRRIQPLQERMRAGNERILHVSDLGFHELNDKVSNAATPAARASAYSALDSALIKGIAEFAAGYREMRLAFDAYADLLDEWLGGKGAGSEGVNELSDDEKASLRSVHFDIVNDERKLEEWAFSLDEMSKQAQEGPPELNAARVAFQEAARQVEIDHKRAREQLTKATTLIVMAKI